MKELCPVSPEQKLALKELMGLLHAHIPEQERLRLIRRVLRIFNQDGSACAAISQGLGDEARGQKSTNMILLGVDWRGFDIFECQAPLIVKALGLSTSYHYQHAGKLSMPEVLAQFDEWLRGMGKRYLHHDSESDRYEGLIVDADKVDEAIVLAERAGSRMRLECF